MKASQKDHDEFNNKTELNISQLREFEYIFKKLPIGIAIIDPTTEKFIFINSNFAQILGYTEEELLKRTFQSITHPEDLNKNLELHEKLRKGETDSYNIEKRNVRKDGSIIWVDLTVSRLKDKKNRREFHLWAIFDLSVRKLAEQKLKASEELFRTVITNAPISIFATDNNGVFTLHEGKAIERVGMKAGENVGASAYDLFAGLKVMEHNGQVTSGESILDSVSNGEYLSGITELNGVVFDNHFAPIWDENGKVAGLLGVATDITDQKRLEKERLEFEKRYQMLFNEIDEGFCIIEMIFDEKLNPIDYRFLEVNPAFEKQTDLADAQGKRMRELRPQHENYWFEIYGKIALTGEPCRFVNRAEQLHRWYDVYAFSFGQPEKRQVAILFNDITGRKRIQDELREREEKWQNMFEILPVGVSIVNTKNNILEINDALSEILDIPKNKLISAAYSNRSYFRSDMTPMPPEEFPSFRALNEKKIIRDVEIGIKKEDGSIIWTNVSAAPMSSLYTTVTITADITKNKKTLEKIRKSECNLEEAERIGNSGSWDYNIATDTATWSKNMFRIFDVDPEMPKELVFKHFVENLVHPDDKEHVRSVFQDALKGKRPYNLEYRIIQKDGNIKNVHAIAETLFDERGNALRMIGKVEDITPRKQAEDALRKSENDLNEAQRLAKIGSWDWDATTDTIRWSKEYYRIYGFDPQKSPTGYEEHLKVYTPKSIKILDNAVKNSMQTGAGYVLELELASMTGSARWVRARGECKFDVGGKIIGLRGSAQDITELKKEEELLRFRAEIAANLSEGVSLIREKDGIIVHTNLRFDEMFGYNQGELIGKHVYILNAPVSNLNEMETANTIINSVRESGKWKGVVYNVKKDGSFFWSQSSVTQFKHSIFGTVLITIQMDITEQVQAEMTLLENEIRQRAMIANISDVIAIVDRNGINRFKSPNVEKWFGWKAEDLIGKNTFDNIHSEDRDRIKDVFYSLLAEPGKAINAECRYLCMDNCYKWIELKAVNQIDNPAISGILVNYHDISERKKAREKIIRHEKELKLLSSELINTQEKEKKILAIELHDEIGQALTAMKINLSAILKNIPAETNNQVCERIKESDQLLDSIMSHIHDISLNLRPAMLDLLGFVSTIKSYTQQFEKRTSIKVRVTENRKTNLNSEQEINLFRIVQEALTNVAKHADAQNIEICLHSGKKWFELTINDNGKGFDANQKGEITVSPLGIGLIGMNERVNVLQGKFSISSSRNKGTKIKIKVPLHGKEK